MKIGDIVYGKVTNILGYGAFVLVEEYDGLVHISEFSDNFVKTIREFVSVGQEIRLRVLEVDEENDRIVIQDGNYNGKSDSFAVAQKDWGTKEYSLSEFNAKRGGTVYAVPKS